ncbi:MAG TPA: orotidine-5'-phosphate decarboxylase [Candidatus Limnocylindria bacterium]|jgi:orotidine-5'-phosphate decarboxylase|nr:orotidine-5'-phosphate decarboxylase [Candidatus Limnocylindria bacterium]
MSVPRLVVALDVPDSARAVSLVRTLAPLGVLFKIGYEAFYGYADTIRAALAEHEAGYALDLKLHDIPNTVHAAVRAVVRPGVRLMTVHALGGATMLETAVAAAHERAAELAIPAPEIYAVTILTSIAGEELGELGLAGGPGENAIRLAALARDARCSGVVCSVREVASLKSFFGTTFGTFCPGIRPSGSAHGDQKRAATPRDAREAGADYVVVGRPIVGDADPLNAARAILAELAA